MLAGEKSIALVGWFAFCCVWLFFVEEKKKVYKNPGQVSTKLLSFRFSRISPGGGGVVYTVRSQRHRQSLKNPKCEWWMLEKWRKSGLGEWIAPPTWLLWFSLFSPVIPRYTFVYLFYIVVYMNMCTLMWVREIICCVFGVTLRERKCLVYCSFAESVEENVHKIRAKLERKTKPDALFFTVIGNVQGRQRGESYEGSLSYSEGEREPDWFFWRVCNLGRKI